MYPLRIIYLSKGIESFFFFRGQYPSSFLQFFLNFFYQVSPPLFGISYFYGDTFNNFYKAINYTMSGFFKYLLDFLTYMFDPNLVNMV